MLIIKTVLTLAYIGLAWTLLRQPSLRNLTVLASVSIIGAAALMRPLWVAQTTLALVLVPLLWLALRSLWRSPGALLALILALLVHSMREDHEA